jgi:hypothetical protein
MARQIEVDRVAEIRREVRKKLGAEILFDLAYQWHRGETADFAYIAGRVAQVSGLPAEAWKAAQEAAGAQVDEDQADADAAAEGDDFDTLR